MQNLLNDQYLFSSSSSVEERMSSPNRQIPTFDQEFFTEHTYFYSSDFQYNNDSTKHEPLYNATMQAHSTVAFLYIPLKY